MSNLRLLSVSIKNVLGLEDLELTPTGNIIEISGKNGAGKTSTCEALKSALGVSEYSSLLRNGEEKGEVVLDLGEIQIRKTYKESGETLTLKGKVAGTDSMSVISSPAKFLKGLVNPNSVDPIRLLTAKPKELVDAVLSALPMVADKDQLSKILGKEPNIDLSRHALLVIANLTKELTEERKLVNRDISTAKITSQQLEETIPENVPLSQEIHEEIEANNKKAETITTSARGAARKIRSKYREELDTLEKEEEGLQEEIAALQAELSLVRLKVKQNKETSEEESEAERERVLATAQDYLNENKELSEKLSQLGAWDRTKEQVRGWKDSMAKSQKVSDAMTESLKGLQVYKEDLCKDLPIEGLAIVDGRLTMNGINFETLNTANRVKLVVELAKLTAGSIGVVVIDNSEHLDTETYKLFIEEARKTELTFVVARVRDGDFKVGE